MTNDADADAGFHNTESDGDMGAHSDVAGGHSDGIDTGAGDAQEPDAQGTTTQTVTDSRSYRLPVQVCPRGCGYHELARRDVFGQTGKKGHAELRSTTTFETTNCPNCGSQLERSCARCKRAILAPVVDRCRFCGLPQPWSSDRREGAERASIRLWRPEKGKNRSWSKNPVHDPATRLYRSPENSRRDVWVVDGDIARLAVDAVVSNDDVDGQMWAQVASAIKNAAGVGVERLAQEGKPFKLGQAWVTAPGALQHLKGIVHVASLTRNGEVTIETVRKCLAKALKIAVKEGYESIGIGAIGSGPAAIDMPTWFKAFAEVTTAHLNKMQGGSRLSIVLVLFEPSNLTDDIELLRSSFQEAQADFHNRSLTTPGQDNPTAPEKTRQATRHKAELKKPEREPTKQNRPKPGKSERHDTNEQPATASTGDSPETPPNGSSAPGGDSRKLLFEVLGLGAGLAAYAYAAGGIVEFLRFAGAGLPAFQALWLLSDKQLLGTGAAVLLLVIPVAAFIAAIHWLLGRRDARKGRKGARPDSLDASRLSEPTKAAVESGVAAASASGLAALVLAAAEAADATGVAAAVGVAGGLGAAFGALGLPLVATVKWRGLTQLPRRWIVTLLLTSVLIGGATLAYFEPLRLARSIVRLSNGTCIEGLYLSQDSDGFHLVDGHQKRLVTVERTKVDAIQIDKSVLADIPITSVSCTRMSAASRI